MSTTTTPATEILSLTETSLQAQREYDETILNLEIQKRANALGPDIVPTLPSDIKQSLRNINEPIHLFGENFNNQRSLRFVLIS